MRKTLIALAGASSVAQVGDDLGEVGGGADAVRGFADDGDGVHSAVGGVAGGRLGHAIK